MFVHHSASPVDQQAVAKDLTLAKNGAEFLSSEFSQSPDIQRSAPPSTVSIEGRLVQSRQLPKHVGIIMDGNGRWAKQRGKPRVFGHRNGVQSVRQSVKAAGEWGIEALTLYAFSDENWRRPREEVSVIMSLLETYIRKETDELDRRNVQLRVIGDVTKLSPSIQMLLEKSVDRLRHNSGLILNLALSYGGRTEILEAVKEISAKVKRGEVTIDQIDADLMGSHLYTSSHADVDLVIRTSGEQRLSNFLLWQSAYAEFYFTEKLWPDFSRTDFAEALFTYMSRQRRFGLSGEQAAELASAEIASKPALHAGAPAKLC